MSLSPKKFRITLAAGLGLVVVCNAIYQVLISSTLLTGLSIAPLKFIIKHSPAANKPMMMAINDQVRHQQNTVENILTGTSTAASLLVNYFTEKAPAIIFLEQGTTFPYYLHLNLDHYLDFSPKKIKYLTASGGWTFPFAEHEIILPRPVGLSRTRSFIENTNEYLKQNPSSPEVINKLVKSNDAVKYGFLTGNSLASHFPSVLLQGLMTYAIRPIVAPRPRAENQKSYLTIPEAITYNFFLIEKFLNELEQKRIEFYFIEDRIKESCVALEKPELRQFMIDKAIELQARHTNFKFIRREELPIIADEHYTDCVHVKIEKADWKNEKIKFITEI